MAIVLRAWVRDESSANRSSEVLERGIFVARTRIGLSQLVQQLRQKLVARLALVNAERTIECLERRPITTRGELDFTE